MREGWTYKKLGEVCEVTDYVANGSFATLRENVQYKSEPDYAILIRLADYTNNFDSSKFVYINEHAYNFLAKSKLYGGEIIMSNVGSLGKEFICPKLDRPMSLAPNSIVIRTPFNKYFYYCFSSTSLQEKIKSISSQTALPKFNKTQFKKLVVPIPPLSVQQSIVAELDKINELISLKKAQLSDLDSLAQSIFYDMFGDPIENEKGWEVKKLGEVGVEKLSYGSGASAIEYDGETRYVRITDITDGGELDTNVVSPNVIENKYLLNDGDILFARSGATVGKTFLYTPKYGRCIYAGYLIRYIPDKKVVLPLYVFALTKTNYYKSFISSSQRAVAQPNINAKQYSDLQIPLPPLSLQQDFAKRIELIEQQKAQISSTIKDLETLLASRMQYWFD